MSKLLSRRSAMERRSFLASGAALVLSASIPVGGRMARADSLTFAPNAFIRIGEDGKIVLIMRDAEMGQGIWTGASMLLAEELNLGLDQVTPDFAPPNNKLYANPLLHEQATGGSTSIRGDWNGPDTNLAIAVLGNAANAFVMRWRSPVSPLRWLASARGVPRQIWNRQRSNVLSVSDAWRSERRCDAGVGTHRSTASNILAGAAR